MASSTSSAPPKRLTRTNRTPITRASATCTAQSTRRPGAQTSSLATLYGFRGIGKPTNAQVPLTIDEQYVPGFTWTREPQIRYVQDFGAGFQVGVSAETAATTFG